MELKLMRGYLVSYSTMLLIVPYGIETANGILHVGMLEAFNRTLWN